MKVICCLRSAGVGPAAGTLGTPHTSSGHSDSTSSSCPSGPFRKAEKTPSPWCVCGPTRGYFQAK